MKGVWIMIEIQERSVTFKPPENAAYLIGDFTDWDERPLPITTAMTLEFPQGAYIEYAFMDAEKQPVADQTNSQRPKNPWYDYHRSIVLPKNRFHIPSRPQAFRGNVYEHVIDSLI